MHQHKKGFLKKNIFLLIAASFLFVGVACGITQGELVYKSADREVLFKIEARDAEAVSALLAFISTVLATISDRSRNQ